MAYVKNSKHKKKCDALWAALVKKRAKGKCEYCGTEAKGLNAHHVYSRANGSTRHDPENGVALCPLHHSLGSQFSAHLTPMEFAAWITEKRGEDWLKALRQRAKTPLLQVDYSLMAMWLEKETGRL